MSEEKKRLHRCCFTGHRPDKMKLEEKEINDRYFIGCYQVRNECMVDRSNLVISVFNGQKSGTKNTVEYAKRKGIKVINVLDII